MLPKYFKSILWFTDFKKLSLKKDRDLILFQVLEKGRMEHLQFIASELTWNTIYFFAKENSSKLSRKSILPFIEIMRDSNYGQN